MQPDVHDAPHVLAAASSGVTNYGSCSWLEPGGHSTHPLRPAPACCWHSPQPRLPAASPSERIGPERYPVCCLWVTTRCRLLPQLSLPAGPPIIVWSSSSQMVGKAVPGPSAEALCSNKRQGINVNPSVVRLLQLCCPLQPGLCQPDGGKAVVGPSARALSRTRQQRQPGWLLHSLPTLPATKPSGERAPVAAPGQPE